MSKKANIELMLFGSIFSVVGVGIFSISVGNFIHTKKFVDNSLATTGEVVELIRRESSSSKSHSRVYYPLIKYEPKPGQIIEFESSTGTNPPAYKVGQKVPIIYDPNHPEIGEINSFFNVWGSFIILLLLGGIFSAVGFGIVGVNLFYTLVLNPKKQIS